MCDIKCQFIRFDIVCGVKMKAGFPIHIVWKWINSMTNLWLVAYVWVSLFIEIVYKYTICAMYIIMCYFQFYVILFIYLFHYLLLFSQPKPKMGWGGGYKV